MQVFSFNIEKLFLTLTLSLSICSTSLNSYADDINTNTALNSAIESTDSTETKTKPFKTNESKFKDIQSLGTALFFDVNLSINRNQSCATCHNPAKGFIDDRKNIVDSATSIGSDDISIGDRNTPTASYASLTPPFSKNKEGEYIGGLFHDGRANLLQDQAEGPPLNLGEMAMPSKDAVLERLLENADYATSFPLLFNQDVFQDSSKAYSAMSKAIAEFEKTEFFSSFDSRYDRYLKGEEQFTELEKLGETLFFSQQFTNCNQCHQLKQLPGQPHETFTNYQYRNIGVPINQKVRNATNKDDQFTDNGLLDNPLVNDIAQKGKFKIPTLRNVAVTAPYMHNGVFSDLKTVVLFYEKYNSRKKSRQINPETGKEWRQPEVAENIAFEELELGRPLTDKRVNAIVAFMKTLTDRKYEYLLSE